MATMQLAVYTWKGTKAACAIYTITDTSSSGRSILRHNRERLRQSSRRNDLTEIEHALARLDVSALTFEDLSAPMTLRRTGTIKPAPCTRCRRALKMLLRHTPALRISCG